MNQAGTHPDPDLDFTLCLYRHTFDVATMERFLRAVGLHRTVFRDQDGCTFMWGRAGMIALFDASSGETPATPGGAQLCFETNDRDQAVARLQAAGLTTSSWDDPPSPAAGVRDRQGTAIWISQGYHDADDEGEDYERHPVDVVAVRPSNDFAADQDFFALLDFHAPADRDAGREAKTDDVALVGAGSAGVIRLIGPDQVAATVTVTGQLGAPALVGLGFESDQPLQQVADRLQAAGFAVEDLGQAGREAIGVVDPDGVQLEIRRR